MSRISAIICEFNPLHRGHEALIRYASEKSDVVICVMSGNFTQRSECAVFDKYKRSEAALRTGADLVLELPFPWCSAGAEFFALGGVTVGASMGADRFIFGSESGSTDYVMGAANVSLSDGFAEYMNTVSNDKEGAATSYDKAMRHFGYELSSNDKLASEYVKAAKRSRFDVEFEAFKRMCDPSLYKSATDIRELIYTGGTHLIRHLFAEGTADIYPELSDALPSKLTDIEYTYFRLFYKGNENIFDSAGGVADRLRKAALESKCSREFFENAATKKYTNSRLRRAALYLILGVTEDMVRARPDVTILLGANERGRAYLSSRRKTQGISVITKPSAADSLTGNASLQLETVRRADELYSLCLREGVRAGEFLRRCPVII